ncbi:hypothetical protein IscW_ISCW017415 [Ixodes scapularis]|uniref:Uncharacterized protein n=1 Tax=Ixodes scapularis TaxID=6945 RepID=B7PCC3_IXOSC|nr:hypothetical protein IscW_ISCW017415 [Ixodes scapularis]|eukprot:XP_002409641.1 hypothetical protein IscW_ISCW017415 [Ixodes scapularis]
MQRQPPQRQLTRKAQLAHSNWHHMTKLQATLGAVRTWSLIRLLLDPTKNKNHTSQTLRKILHNFKGTK